MGNTSDEDTPKQGEEKNVTLDELARQNRLVAYPAGYVLDLFAMLGRIPGIPMGMTVDQFNQMRSGLTELARLVDSASDAAQR